MRQVRVSQVGPDEIDAEVAAAAEPGSVCAPSPLMAALARPPPPADPDCVLLALEREDGDDSCGGSSSDEDKGEGQGRLGDTEIETQLLL
jgi:hypothetical protein